VEYSNTAISRKFYLALYLLYYKTNVSPLKKVFHLLP